MASGNVLREMFVKIGVIGDKKSKQKIGVFRRSLKAVVGDIKVFQANLAAIGVSKAFSTLNSAISASVNLTKQLIENSIELAGNREGIQASLAGMLQSEEKANKLLRDLSAFGAKTPFQVTDLREYSKVLLGTGFAVEEIIPSLQQLGDLTGGKKDVLNRILINFSQIKTTGRASLIDIRQFAMAGIPIFKALEDTLGVSNLELEKMISDGAIGLKETKAAFDSLTKAGGTFHKQMDRASLTFHGMTSNLIDSWEVAMEKMGEPIIRRLKPVLDYMSKMIGTLTPAFVRFGKKVGEAFSVAMRTIEGIGGADFFSNFLDGFGDFLIITGLLVEDFFKLMRGEKSAIGAFLNIEEGGGFGDIFEGIFKGAVDKFVEGFLWFVAEVTPKLISGTADLLGNWASGMATDIGNLDFLDVAKGAGMDLLGSMTSGKNDPDYQGKSTSNSDYSTKDIKIYNNIKTNQPVGPMTEQMQILGEKLKNGEISL